MSQLPSSITNTLQNKQYELATNLILEDLSSLDTLMDCFFTPKWEYSQRFSNVLEVFKKKHQELILPYFPKWLELLEKPFSDGFQRNSYRYFQEAKIPEEYEGILYDLAFNDMLKTDSAIAIKAFAMTTCFNIAKVYPELLPELKEGIESVLERTESAGVKSRSKKLLHEIEKIM